MKIKIKKAILFSFLIVVTIASFPLTILAESLSDKSAISVFDEDKNRAVIYYNEACGMCAAHVHDDLPRMLSKVGISEFIKKDYVNEKENRVEMNDRINEFEVPLQLQSHIMTFVGDKVVLGGHIPEHVINDIFDSENLKRFKRIIVYQDLMHGDVDDYTVLAIPNYAESYVGEARVIPINDSVLQYLDYLEENEKELSQQSGMFSDSKSLTGVVLVSGFLDGINPCAFAVLLLFIAFLLSIKKGRSSIWKMGIVYISAIFLAYLLIGFGLLKAIMFVNSPHFMAQLGSWLIIILGAITIFNHYSSRRIPINLGLLTASKKVLNSWMIKATLPAAFVMGFLVGLCTFPCSGGIYVAIIGLLVAETSHWRGLGYLLLYNLMFVVPLIIILTLAANKYTFVRFGEWQRKHKKTQKLIMGISMVLLGIVIMTFFIH